jgi:hypothetical protein
VSTDAWTAGQPDRRCDAELVLVAPLFALREVSLGER